MEKVGGEEQEVCIVEELDHKNEVKAQHKHGKTSIIVPRIQGSHL